MTLTVCIRLKPGDRNFIYIGVQPLGPLCTAFPGILARSWIRTRGGGAQTSAPMWDAAMLGEGLTHGATTPAFLPNLTYRKFSWW